MPLRFSVMVIALLGIGVGAGCDKIKPPSDDKSESPTQKAAGEASGATAAATPKASAADVKKLIDDLPDAAKGSDAKSKLIAMKKDAVPQLTETAEKWTAEHEKLPAAKQFENYKSKMMPLFDVARGIGADAKPVFRAIYENGSGTLASKARSELKDLGESVPSK